MNVKTTKTTQSIRTDLTETPEPQTILNPNSSKVLNRRAFTLIEVLIVLSIIAMVLSLGLPAIERVTYQQLNSTARKFVGTMRTIRNDAILLGSIYRMGIDFEKNTWWVESQKEFKLLTIAAEDSKKKKKDKKEAAPTNFEYVAKYNKKPSPLPQGLVFRSVLKETEGLRKEGIVYINFFPNGFADSSIIYISKEGNADAGYSLIVRATAGKVDIERGLIQNF